MSKSLGNVRLLKDALARFPGEAVRYALLSAHYRSPLRWSEDLMHDAKAALDSLYRAAQKSAMFRQRRRRRRLKNACVMT